MSIKIDLNFKGNKEHEIVIKQASQLQDKSDFADLHIQKIPLLINQSKQILSERKDFNFYIKNMISVSRLN